MAIFAAFVISPLSFAPQSFQAADARHYPATLAEITADTPVVMPLRFRYKMFSLFFFFFSHWIVSYFHIIIIDTDVIYFIVYITHMAIIVSSADTLFFSFCSLLPAAIIYDLRHAPFFFFFFFRFDTPLPLLATAWWCYMMAITPRYAVTYAMPMVILLHWAMSFTPLSLICCRRLRHCWCWCYHAAIAKDGCHYDDTYIDATLRRYWCCYIITWWGVYSAIEIFAITRRHITICECQRHAML